MARRALVASLCLAAAAVQALPTEAFARLPQLSSATLSPDGAWLAALVPKGSGTVAVAQPLRGKLPPKAVFDADLRDATRAEKLLLACARSHSEVLRIWEIAVEETRALIHGPWR